MTTKDNGKVWKYRNISIIFWDNQHPGGNFNIKKIHGDKIKGYVQDINISLFTKDMGNLIIALEKVKEDYYKIKKTHKKPKK